MYFPGLPDCGGKAEPKLGSERLPAGSGEVVLVVDDDENVRQVAVTLLEAHGYGVLTAGDGTEALAIFVQNSYRIALVMTDLVMPFMDGVTLIRALRRMTPGIPVVASTGMGDKARLDAVEALGVKAVLRKPYGAKSLVHTIRLALQPASQGPGMKPARCPRG